MQDVGLGGHLRGGRCSAYDDERDAEAELAAALTGRVTRRAVAGRVASPPLGVRTIQPATRRTARIAADEPEPATGTA